MLQANRPPPSKRYKDLPAFQVIVLGSSGGPREDNVTGTLVRSLSTNWETNSVVAIDGGTLLGGIIRCLELSETKPAKFKSANAKEEKDGVQMVNGAFEGLTLPHEAAESNGAWIFRHLVQSVLVTHAHLDHCSALAMNTPLIETETGPKVIGALPSVIAALKEFIFNDVIWPNLSDEDEGAGLVTYQRLNDGGNPMLGRGTGRGYVESCRGIMSKAMSISHGKSRRKYNPDTDKFERLLQSKPSKASGSDDKDKKTEISPEAWAAVDSSAFFLLDVRTGTEILVFGDLEPDCVSERPRNAKVWREAARKLAARSLRGIFVECSYPDAVEDATLFGHMCPRHLIGEMTDFAKHVKRERKLRASNKRDTSNERKESPLPENDEAYPSDEGSPSPYKKRGSPKERSSEDNDEKSSDDDTSQPQSSDDNEDSVPVEKGQQSMGTEAQTLSGDEDIDVSDHPLEGLKVFIVHIKEELSLPKSARETVMSQLNQHKEEVGLGCDFISLVAGEVAYL